MIALRLVRLIETHSDQIARNLVKKIQMSPLTGEIQKVPELELRTRTQEFLQHLGDWLLAKTDTDIQTRYRELGARASQSVALADICWALTLTKEHLWGFVQKQGVLRSPVELYGEMELLWLLDQFFDRALCYTIEGYEQREPSETGTKESPERKQGEVDLAAWVP